MMLDTIKVAIPLTKSQHQRVHTIASCSDTWNWGLVNQGSGEALVRKFKGLAQTDGVSYHRDIRFDYSPQWSRDARLWVEFSVPKFWYGHNIYLLYDWPKALRLFREYLVKQFNLKRLRFSPIEEWEVLRADACYAWGLPDQKIAQLYLDSLKRLRFPRKQPAIHPHSIFFGGGTFAFKLYLKLPEFQVHDKKEMLKRGAALEWIDHCERHAQGVLRAEASMRRKYLTRMGIKTVGDMMGERCWMQWDEHLESTPGFDPMLSSIAIAVYNQHHHNNKNLEHGLRLYAPDISIELLDRCYSHPSGAVTYQKLPILLDRLETLLKRFLGGHTGMQTIDKVEAALSQHYKPAKVARLVGFWLYVKNFGVEKAKEAFSSNAYYTNRRQLKDAGVGMIEVSNDVIKVDPEFFKNFGLDIPSEYAHYKHDENRNSGNVLNISSYRVV